MSAGHSLIDKAVEVCGSRYRLSQLTGVSQGDLSNAYSGKRCLGPVAAAKVASVAGIDAQRAAVVAMIENEKDPAEREVLKGVFFPAGAKAMLLSSIAAGLLATSPTSDAWEQCLPDVQEICNQSVYYVYSLLVFAALMERLRSMSEASLVDRLEDRSRTEKFESI